MNLFMESQGDCCAVRRLHEGGNTLSDFDIGVSSIADTLVSQASLFNCTLEKAWKKYMHPALTEQTTFEEVKKYIDSKVALGEKSEDSEQVT
jgi:hypothetical protein